MRRCLGVLMVVALLLSFGPNANATRTWVSGNSGNWTDTANWSGSTLPSSTETAQISNGTCTLNANETIGQLLMGYASTDNTVLNINTGANFTVSKSSAELICLVKAGTSAGATTTVNHSSGTVKVFSGSGTGEVRLVTASTTTGTATYNLSGTAVLDTEILSKGNKTNSSATFNATGGTLVIRNMIYRFGLISEGAGFNQGQAKLEVGQINTVAAITIGNSTNAMDYTAGTGAILNIDIAGASNYDAITQYGSLANLAGATMQIDLLGGFTPTQGQTFDIWKFNDPSKAGSGAVVGLPTGWSAAWVDTNADASTDTLRLTYTPEPATIALLGLGFLAARRGKK